MNKKLFLSLALLTIVVSGIGQIKAGQWITGGNAAFLYSKTSGSPTGFSNTNKATNFQGTGDFGYFFRDQVCGGIAVGASRAVVKQELKGIFSGGSAYFSSTDKVTALVFSPFVRYYFLPNGKKLNIIGEVSYVYSYNKSKSETTEVYTNPNTQLPSTTYSLTTVKDHSDAYSIAAGPALFMTSRTSLELLVAYMHSKSSNAKSSSDIVGISAGFQIHLGK